MAEKSPGNALVGPHIAFPQLIDEHDAQVVRFIVSLIEVKKVGKRPRLHTLEGRS